MKKKYLAVLLAVSLLAAPMSVGAEELFTDGGQEAFEVTVPAEQEEASDTFGAGHVEAEEALFEAGLSEEAEEELPEVETSQDVEMAQATYKDYEFEFNKSAKTASIVKYTGTSAENVSIPSAMIGADGTSYTLTKIGKGAFERHTELKKVQIPATVINIGEGDISTGAFQNCTNLTEVTIMKGTKKSFLGSKTFNGCTSLKSIVIPGNYYYIDNYAFEGCTSLETMKLEANTTGDKQTLSKRAFAECTSLRSISLPTTLEYIGEDAFIRCARLEKAVIPEGVWKINDSAFAYCSSLTSVVLPSTIERIGNSNLSAGVFQDCINLTSVTLKPGVKKTFLGRATFNGCIRLPSIVIPGNYYYIEYGAFENCTALKSVKLEAITVAGKQTIGDRAFDNCTSLTELSLPETVESIRDNAFRNCTSLKKLVIPEGVVYIKTGAFSGCISLTDVVIPSTMERLGNTNNSAGVFEGCIRLVNVTIKEGRKAAIIGIGAFSGCSSLKKIVIPGNYNEILRYAFDNCTSLEEIELCESTLGAINRVLDDQIVRGCVKLVNFKIPESVGVIRAKAFEACPNVTIIGKTGSAAQIFAAEKGVKFSTKPLPLSPVTLAKPALSAVKQSAASYNVVFSWKPVQLAKSYYVYRKTGTGAWKKLAAVTGTSYTDKTAKTVGTVYTYTVRAYGGAGTTLSSYNAGLKLTIRPFTPKLTKVTSTSSGMKVQWNASSNATGYLVYRRLGTGSWSRIAVIGKKTTLSYLDKTAKKGKSYSYRVYAYRKAGTKNVNSAASAILTGKR